MAGSPVIAQFNGKGSGGEWLQGNGGSLRGRGNDAHRLGGDLDLDFECMFSGAKSRKIQNGLACCPHHSAIFPRRNLERAASARPDLGTSP